MNNLHKINKILILTLMVFSIGVFGNYSETASKYWIQDKNDNILNKTSFTSLTSEINPFDFQIIGDKAQIIVEFFRTAAIGDDSVIKDEINFQLIDKSEKCRIIKVSNSSTGLGKGFYKNESNTYSPVPKEGDYQNNVNFVYNDITSNITNNTRVSLTIECDAEDILETEGDKKDYLQINYRAIEKLTTKKGEVVGEEEFKMFGGTYYSNSKYEKPKGYEITGNRKEKLVLTSAELSEQIINEWILEYVTTNFTKVNSNNNAYNYLRNYINYKSTWNPSSVLGLTYDAAKKEYTFDDVIISYAFTSYFAHANRRLYFIHFDNAKLAKEKVDPLFEDYYDKYYKSKYTDTENTEILQYIADNGGISSVVVDDKPLTGVTYQSNYVVLDKDLIMATLHPITPDVILDFAKYPTTEGKMIQYISTSVSDYVKNVLGVADYDANKVLQSIFISRYLNELEGKDAPNDYYYLVVDDTLLSMRFYKNDSGEYMMHMGAFDDSSTDSTATSHVLIATEKYFMASTDVNDYAELRTQFLRYVQKIDNEYGTTFMDIAGARFDAVANMLMNPPAGESTGHVTMTNRSFQDSTKGYSLVLNYLPVETEDGTKYGRLSFSFTPPTV